MIETTSPLSISMINNRLSPTMSKLNKKSLPITADKDEEVLQLKLKMMQITNRLKILCPNQDSITFEDNSVLIAE
jgi:hypothetical protein